MKYRIVIRAFTLRRDVASAVILAKIFERMGCEVFIGSVRNFTWVVKYWKPHAIISNAPGKVIAANKLAPNSLLFHLPGEGGEFIEQSDAKLFQNNGAYKLVSGIFVWGEEPLSYYDKVLPGCDKMKLFLTGNPRLDLVKFNNNIQRDFRQSGSIGVVSRFTQINDHDGAPTSHFLMRPWNLPRVIRECIGFDTTIRLIEQILEKTDYSVDYRPYPLEDPATYRSYPKKLLGDRFSVDESLDFAHWASKQRMIISQVSTTFLEPYLLRIPIMSLDKIIDSRGSENKWDGYVSQDSSYLPNTFEEAIDIINSDIDIPKRVDTVESALEKFNGYYLPGSALHKVASIVVEMLKECHHKNTYHVPRSVIDVIDAVSFYKAYKYNPHNVNFSYKQGYHKIPDYYDDIVDNIFSEFAQPELSHSKCQAAA